MALFCGSELIEITVEWRDGQIKTLPLTDGLDGLSELAALLERITLEVLPVVEDHLREGLTGGGTTKVLIETEGLHNRKMGLDHHERSTLTLLLVESTATPLAENAVDTTADGKRGSDFGKVDWLDEGRGGSVL